MKRLISTLLLLTAVFQLISAQELKELIEQNPDRAANIYHRYETFGTDDTPAPKGYKPFYISHYGRHGSRYHSSDKFFIRAIEPLQKCSDAGLLTPTGQELLSDLNLFFSTQEGLDGILTQIGSDEHRQIADRMYKRFPEVFNQRDRKDIKCISSISQRCIQSMANFTLALNTDNPDLNIRLYTGSRYMAFICNSVPLGPYSKVYEAVKDSITIAMLNPDRIMKLCFTDSEAAAKLIGKAPQLWIRDVYSSGCIRQDIETELPDIFSKYFTTDELYAFCRADNARCVSIFGNTAELGPFLPTGVGRPLLAHIIECADDAVKGNDRAADLRFGHDTGLAPLLFLMGIKPFDFCLPITEAIDKWFCFREMCMGSNVQMIFYRNKAGEVIVKILHNERETTIEAVPTFCGQYHKWSDLRPYLLSRLQD